jgi:hypothetical protein
MRILDRNEVVYTGLAHRHRAVVRAAPFALEADVLLVLALCAARTGEAHVERSSLLEFAPGPMPALMGVKVAHSSGCE